MLTSLPYDMSEALYQPSKNLCSLVLDVALDVAFVYVSHVPRLIASRLSPICVQSFHRSDAIAVKTKFGIASPNETPLPVLYSKLTFLPTASAA
jgi:hypothetical protein